MAVERLVAKPDDLIPVPLRVNPGQVHRIRPEPCGLGPRPCDGVAASEPKGDQALLGRERRVERNRVKGGVAGRREGVVKCKAGSDEGASGVFEDRSGFVEPRGAPR